MPIVHVHVAAGRTPIEATKVLIVLHEPPLECWGIRGGQPASKANVGFKLDV